MSLVEVDDRTELLRPAFIRIKEGIEKKEQLFNRVNTLIQNIRIRTLDGEALEWSVLCEWVSFVQDSEHIVTNSFY